MLVEMAPRFCQWELFQASRLLPFRLLAAGETIRSSLASHISSRIAVGERMSSFLLFDDDGPSASAGFITDQATGHSLLPQHHV